MNFAMQKLFQKWEQVEFFADRVPPERTKIVA